MKTFIPKLDDLLFFSQDTSAEVRAPYSCLIRGNKKANLLIARTARYGFLFSDGRCFSLQKRLGFIGIIVEERNRHASDVNELLSNYGELIIARTGIPYSKRGCAVISLIVDATTDQIGELAGKLGSIPDISVKSMLSREKQLTGGKDATTRDKHRRSQ